MKMNQSLSLLIAGSLVVLNVGCASHSKKEEAPPPTLAQKAEASMQTNQAEYVTRTEARLDQLNKFSADLHSKASMTPKPQGKKLSNAADDLDSLLKEVTKQLGDVKAAAPANWIDEKRDVDKAMSRAETQYSNAVGLLK